ncbi:MAG: hypothetical protein M0Z94_08350 [Dehalococcoidales bacterium]|nr:hypothetical protein [Dehalococcoidales bacterium]
MLLIDALRAAGWPEAELGNALGVVSLESAGNPAAHNPGTPIGAEDSWGLFQINRLAHGYTVEQLCDPVFNATVARGLWQARGGCYTDWWNAAQALGICPFGGAQHSVADYAALANTDVGGGNGGGLPAGWDVNTIALGLLGLAAVMLILDL